MNTLFFLGGEGGTGFLLMIVLMFGVMYFFMIRPQQKKQREQQEALQKARDAMKSGDKVVTAGGIHGRIKEVGDTWLLVEVADGVKMKFEKTSVFTSSADVQQK